MRATEVQQRISDFVIEVPQTSRKEFDQFIRLEIARGAVVMNEATITAEQRSGSDARSGW